jgi:hypothetical protein
VQEWLVIKLPLHLHDAAAHVVSTFAAFFGRQQLMLSPRLPPFWGGHGGAADVQ